MQIITYKILLIPGLIWCLATGSVSSADQPWRLHEALNLPSWVSISGIHRTLFETLDKQFRANRNGGDQVLLFQTLVLAELKFAHFKIGAELQDARAVLNDTGSTLTTNSVNPLELLQAYTAIPMNDLFVPGSTSTLKGGRFTLDIGTRRLVARNRYRNAINAFTGLEWQWQSPDKSQLRLFYTLPVQRRVDGNILDNNPRLDKEREDVRFWGMYYAPGKLPWGDKGEIYLYGLNEDDTPDLATRERDIYTTGFRLYRPAAKGGFDYEVESVFQFGESRASTASVVDLDHFAHFQHLEVGYSLDAPWSPRLQLQYDYASGDDNPADGDNNRFDSLFGPGRFDFGPTNSYTAFVRTNISSPGLRLTVKPRAGWEGFVALRGFWLASNDDIWTTAGIGNPPGLSERHIGTQFEGRLRWDVVPRNVRLESGFAHIFSGDLMSNAGKGDATFLYTSLNLTF